MNIKYFLYLRKYFWRLLSTENIVLKTLNIEFFNINWISDQNSSRRYYWWENDVKEKLHEPTSPMSPIAFPLSHIMHVFSMHNTTTALQQIFFSFPLQINIKCLCFCPWPNSEREHCINWTFQLMQNKSVYSGSPKSGALESASDCSGGGGERWHQYSTFTRS